MRLSTPFLALSVAVKVLSPTAVLAENCLGDDAQETVRLCSAQIDSGGSNVFLSEAYRQRAGAWMGQGKPKKAMADIDKAIKLNPDNVWAYYRRALIHADYGDAGQAIADFKHVLEVMPDDQRARDILDYMQQGQHLELR